MKLIATTRRKAPSIAGHRLELSQMVDDRQERIATGLIRSAPLPDFAAIADGIVSLTERHRVMGRIHDEIHSQRFRQHIAAVNMHGYALALWASKRDGVPVLLGRSQFSEAIFAETIPWRPEDVVAYWKNKIPLTDEQAARLLENLNTFFTTTLAVAGEYSQAVLFAVSELFTKAIAEGMTLAEFRGAFTELIPNKSRALIETIFRTNLTKSYASQRYQNIRDAGAAVPFIQFLGVKDDRQTATICKPMSGFIAAAKWEGWATWTPPNHWNCRSDLSGIPYLEARRMGLVDYGANGRGLVYPKGILPFGPPPKYATDPKTGALRRVAPAIGFGANEKQFTIAA